MIIHLFYTIYHVHLLNTNIRYKRILVHAFQDWAIFYPTYEKNNHSNNIFNKISLNFIILLNDSGMLIAFSIIGVMI
jgi:hypothetical protein